MTSLRTTPVTVAAVVIALSACGSAAEPAADVASSTEAVTDTAGATTPPDDSGDGDSTDVDPSEPEPDSDSESELCLAMEPLVDIDPFAQRTPEEFAQIERVAELAPDEAAASFDVLLAIEAVLLEGPLEDKFDEVLAIAEAAGDVDEEVLTELTAACGLFVPVLGDEIDDDVGDEAGGESETLTDQLYGLFDDGLFVGSTTAGGAIDLTFRDLPTEADVVAACATITSYFADEAIEYQQLTLTNPDGDQLISAQRPADGSDAAECVLNESARTADPATAGAAPIETVAPVFQPSDYYDGLIDELYALFPDDWFSGASIFGGIIELQFAGPAADDDVAATCSTITEFLAAESLEFAQLILTGEDGVPRASATPVADALGPVPCELVAAIDEN